MGERGPKPNLARQREAVKYARQGLSTRDIAALMGITHARVAAIIRQAGYHREYRYVKREGR